MTRSPTGGGRTGRGPAHPRLDLTRDVLQTLAVAAFVIIGLSRSENQDTLLMNATLLAISALGVSLVLGLAGQPALCQAAFMLVGAYAYAITGRNSGLGLPPLLGVGVAVACGLVLAGAVSPVLRARGYTFALATIALDLFVRQAFKTGTWVPGGAGGIPDAPPLELFGRELLEPTDYFWLGAAVVAVTGALLHLRYGRNAQQRALRVLGSDQDLLTHLGQRTARRKRELFILAGGLGALAGALTAASFGFVEPNTFGSQDSFALATVVVIGGRGRLAGAVLGAFVYLMADPLIGPDLAAYQPVLLGATVIATMHFLPEGPLPRAIHLVRRIARVVGRRPTPTATPTSDGRSPFTAVDGATLTVRRVVCDFDAVRAVDQVDFDLDPGTITALVGPNGAGKSTLLAAVAGDHLTAGTVLLDGRDITKMPADARARAGIARSHQHIRLVSTMTVADSVLLGADLAAVRHGRQSESDKRSQARRCLDEAGIVHLAEHRVTDLGFGQRRLVDLARLMASRPRLALLDEPSAGLDQMEQDALIQLLQRFNQHGCTILLVEHDLRFVRALAQRAVALVDGAVIAVGPVDEVYALPAFEAAYLGGVVPT